MGYLQRIAYINLLNALQSFSFDHVHYDKDAGCSRLRTSIPLTEEGIGKESCL